ncbi:MAG TPA: THUMP domain-containing protein [Spirochaetota bacterium]|nr:THUMP domain-containing protein [Spirochaetota bacterium]
MEENFTITCQSGLEEVLSKELIELGLKQVEIGSQTVSFIGDEYLLYKTNMALRSGLNVLRLLKTFNASDYDILYFQAKKIHWHKLFTHDKTIRIDVKGYSPNLTHSQYILHRVKDGIMDTFRTFFDSQRPSISIDDPDIHILVYLNGNKVSIYLDSSGLPLFKRGYRVKHNEAPIKEDLAAGIILQSDWDRKQNVLDPMCGSGTFLIESFMIANNIPPNIDRKFAFMNWIDFDETVYKKAKEDLKKSIIKNTTLFQGYDVDNSSIKISNEIIKKLGYEEFIKVEKMDFRKVTKDFNNYFIVANPPYGERMGKEEDMKDLYIEIGDFLKQRCKNSIASIFTANLVAGKFIGLRTCGKIKLYNGKLEARHLKFKIF